MELGKLSNEFCITCGKGVRFVNGFLMHIDYDSSHDPEMAMKESWETAVAEMNRLKQLVREWPADSEEACTLLTDFGEALMRDVSYLPFGNFEFPQQIDLVDVAIMVSNVTPDKIVMAVRESIKKVQNEN
jgi:hypothetical protein